MRWSALFAILPLALAAPACDDSIALDDYLDDDDDTGDDDTGDDDTTEAPPEHIDFMEVTGGYGGPAFVIDGELYVIYGAQILRRITDASSELIVDSSPTGLNCQHGYAVQVYQGKAYVLGGHYQPDPNCTAQSASATDRVWVFDPQARTLELGPSMHHRREVLATGVADGSLWVLGGWDPVDNEDGINNDVVERFDGDAWVEVPYSGDYAAPRSPAYASVGDSIYLFGGCEQGLESPDDCPCASQRVQVFDAVSRTFEQRAMMPIAGRHFSGQHTANRGQYVYVFGGAADFSCDIYDDIARYDTHDDSWEPLPETLTKPRKSTGAAILDDRLFVYGGITCPADGCEEDLVCEHAAQIPSCPHTGAGTNEIGTFLAD